jgi:hypothetical protein
MALNPHDPRMPVVTDQSLHWERCQAARELYLQSGASVWVRMGQQAGCSWPVGLQGAEMPTAVRIPPLIVAATAIFFSGIAYMTGRR